MKNNPSIISFNSISKFNDDYNSSITMNTINPNSASLSFRVKFETTYGQSVYIIGSIEELGQWDTSKAVQMFTNHDIYPTWEIKKEFVCPLGLEIDYKYFLKDGNKIIWEDLGQNTNRHIIVQSPGNLIIFDEKSNHISKIKTSGFNQINSGNINLSNTDYNLLQELKSSHSFRQNVFISNPNNNNILSSGLLSNQSLSSYQKQSEYSFQLNEEENHNNFENFSSKDIESIDGEGKNFQNNMSNKENYSQFDILNIYQGIKPDDKIVIVTTFLPFILEINENYINNDNNNSLDISDSKSNLNNKYKTILYEDKLVNLILYRLKGMNYCKVYWVGMLPGISDYPDDLQFEIFDYLQSQNIFVVLPKKNDFFHFQMYINKILHPIYNDSVVDISPYFIMNKENYYFGYCNINKNFADTLITNLDKEPKMILINDIDLALVPSYLLTEIGKYKYLKGKQLENNNTKNMGESNICFILNSNIPDYNSLSLLHSNKDLLKSILLCDSLGFHSFSQAKNFMNAAKIYFDANYKVKFNGQICIEYFKREIPLFIRDVHIKKESIKNIYKNFSTKDKPNINNNENKIINLLSIDSISNINDILNKLNIFLDLNKTQYLGYKYKLELVVEKDRYADSYLNEVNEKNQRIINDKIKVIKENIGQDFNLLLKISFVDFISVKEQIRCFSDSDIFLLSDNNIWSGMMPLIQEFIIVQNEIINNKLERNNSFNKIVGLIVSENLIIQEDLKFIKKVNFYEIKSIKDVFKEIMEMNKDEKYNLIQNDCEQFQKCSIILWIKDLLSQLKNVLLTNKNKERVEEGFGLDFCYYLISKSFTKLNPKKIQALLKNSSHRLFLLNLKTIFSNIDSNNLDNKNSDVNEDINNKSISDSYIDDNKKVINILNELSHDKNNIICLFTDESKDIFKNINLNSINFYFIAEDGFIKKPIGEQNFKNEIYIKKDWKIPIITIFKNFIKKTGFGEIVEKEYSVSWNYNAEEKGNYLLGKELKFLIENFIDNKNFYITLEKNYLEVKIKNGNNINYKYIDEILHSYKNLKLIFALNDSNRRGDKLFEYLHNKKRANNDNLENINLITVTIGKQSSKACYYLKDIQDFINIFNSNNI